MHQISQVVDNIHLKVPYKKDQDMEWVKNYQMIWIQWKITQVQDHMNYKIEIIRTLEILKNMVLEPHKELS